jgi:hypothetical protein
VQLAEVAVERSNQVTTNSVHCAAARHLLETVDMSLELAECTALFASPTCVSSPLHQQRQQQCLHKLYHSQETASSISLHGGKQQSMSLDANLSTCRSEPVLRGHLVFGRR